MLEDQALPPQFTSNVEKKHFCYFLWQEPFVKCQEIPNACTYLDVLKVKRLKTIGGDTGCLNMS